MRVASQARVLRGSEGWTGGGKKLRSVQKDAARGGGAANKGKNESFYISRLVEGLGRQAQAEERISCDIARHRTGGGAAMEEGWWEAPMRLGRKLIT